jgi:hypothetical protein
MRSYKAEDLHTFLDGDLVWRRRELTTLVGLAQTADAASKAAILRSSVPILYAHWEGFGKNCAVKYLEFVSFRSKSYAELSPSFIYLAMSPTLGKIANSPASVAIPMLQDALKFQEKKNRDKHKSRLNTKSNLRYDVLEDMLTICGLDPSPFKNYASFIDKELCDPRNSIAHGEDVCPDLELLKRRRNTAFEIMTALQTSVVNAATNKSYLAKVVEQSA